MAPEVVNGNRYGLPADVYSFAVLLLEAVLGDIRSVRDQFKKMHQFAAVEGWRPKIPGATWEEHSEIMTLVCRCWHSNPSERPTFEEVVETIENDDSR